MIRIKTSLNHKRIRRLIWLVLTVFLLLSCSLQSVTGSAYYSMLMQPYGTVSSPPVILEEGNCSGTTTIYTNNTSAKVSVVAPAPVPTYYPGGYNVVNGTYMFGTVPSSIQTVDSNYLTIRSVASGTATLAYYPSGYTLGGSTTWVSGGISNLTSNDNVYMTLRSYENTSCTLQYYNSSEGNSQTNSATYSDKLILTFTPSLAGDYLIIASAALSGSSASYDVRVRMTIDGTIYANPTWQPDEANMWESFFTSKVISFASGSHTVRIQFSSPNVAQTVTIRRARIMALKLSNFESNEVESEQSVTSGTYVDVVTKSFTPSTAGAYLIVATAEVRAASTTNSISARLQIDGEAKDEMITEGETTTDYEVFAAHNVTTLSAASHTIKIQASQEGGGNMYIRRARVTAVRLSDYYDYQTSGSEGVSSTTSTAWVDKTVLTFTPSAAGDYLIMATAKITLNTATNGFQPAINFTIDGTEYGYWQAGLSDATDYLTFATMLNASLSAASHTIKIAYCTTSGSYTASIKDARIVAFKLAKQYISEVEFTGASNTYNWAQLTVSVDSSWTVGYVSVYIQVYDYQNLQYPTSGQAYGAYTSSGNAITDELWALNITSNPTYYRNSTGNWSMQIKGVKNTSAQFDFKADWIEYKTTYNNEYTVSTEFLFSNMTKNAPIQLNFTVVSEYDIASVNIAIQIWNYSSSAYAKSGEGYLAYTSTSTNTTKILSINTDPQFYTSSGYAKINVTGVNSTTTEFQQKINQIKLDYKYVSYENIEDYVDNTSDVDFSADKGTHSNFTAQQSGPDSVYDTLTEENITGSITYENSVESYSATGQISHNFDYSLQKSSGNDRLVVVTVSWEDAEASASISILTFGGTAMTKITDVTVGTGYSEYISLWYLLDSSLPSNSGSYNVAVTVSESITREIYVGVAEYSGVKQSAPDDSDTNANTLAGNTTITLTAAADGSVVVAGVGEGGLNALTNTNNINNLQEQILTSSGSALGHHTNVSSGDITVGWNNLDTREGMAGAVWQPASNYKLDLEVQWTNANYTQTLEELCIKVGTTDGENIKVDVWNGSGWINVFTDLTPNSWNNVSVSSYLTSSNFTIRFKGDNETDDTAQDIWNIDVMLLHVWTGETYDYILKVVNQVPDNWTINLQVYSSTNIGRLSSLNISLHDGTSSNQIAISGGSIIKSEGEPYSLPGGLGSIVYIRISNLQATTTDTSYLYVYLKIQEPNTSTYILFIIAFEIT